AGDGANAGCSKPAEECDVSTSYGGNDAGSGGWVYGTGGVVTVTASSLPVTISTNGDQSAGIQTKLLGGAGARGGSDNAGIGGTAGNGGLGGAVFGQASITLTGTGQNLVAVTTAGDSSPGIYAASLGGDGGLGGDVMADAVADRAGAGGAGGFSGDIIVTLVSASVGTQGTASPGILAQSVGGLGAAGGASQQSLGKAYGGEGGRGGDAGSVTVTLDSASTIKTQGDD
ncbi:hypothetical protein AB4144_38995, partial [Rhizobiaceae sp. 2RAB30]